MDSKNYSIEEIAELFSKGKFELTYPFLSDNVVWNIVGESLIQGKSKVVENCERTSKYFESVQTEFITEDISVSENKVFVRGSGEFIRNGKRVNLIMACDVYEFNDQNLLERISSYCIPEN